MRRRTTVLVTAAAAVVAAGVTLAGLATSSQRKGSIMGSARWTPNDTHARLLPAGRWDIDPRYSTVSFGGRYLGVLPVRGILARIAGEIFVEPDAGAASVAVLIDAAAVSTPMAQFDARLRSGDFLDVARHPRIGFRSVALWFDDPCWQVTGDLTVKDTVSMVVLLVAPTGVTQHPITGARYAGFTATTELDRFSIGLGSNRDRPDDRPRLSNTVHVQADIVAVLRPACPGHRRIRGSQPIRDLGSSASPGPRRTPGGDMSNGDNLAAPDAAVLDAPPRGGRPDHSAQRWRPHGRRAAMVALGLTGLGLTVGVLAHSRDELLSAITTLARVCPGWVVAAVFAEAVCYLTRGSATGIVLRSATSTAAAAHDTARQTRQAHLSAPVLGAMTMAGDAVAYCLPFGFAAGGVVAVEQLRRRRVPTIVAGWAFTVTTLLYVAVLGVLGIVAVALAGATGAANPFPGLQQAALIALALLLAILALIQARRHTRPSGQIAQLLHPVRRPRAHPSTAADRRVRAHDDQRSAGLGWVRGRRHIVAAAARGQVWWAQLHLLRLSPGAVTTAAVAMLISWLADIAVLAMAFIALGMHPPWLGLLLAYCAGQLASSLPITPGGLGVVEGSLAVALVAFGGCTTGTLAAVLLYRLISHWSVIPAGALAWLIVRRPLHPRTPPGICVPLSRHD